MCETYIIDNSGKKRKAKEVVCEVCGKKFLKPIRFIKKTLHHYCSPKCFHKSTRNRVTVKCAFCGKEFEKAMSKLDNSRSKLYFCCRKCKDEAQKIENGFVEIQPDHYGDGTSSDVYQRICFTHHKHKCCICGEENIVEVHHYNGNHKNNNPLNLVPLCPTHHRYWHSHFRYLIQDKVDEYVNKFKKGFNNNK